jgi:hypothetical protein
VGGGVRNLQKMPSKFSFGAKINNSEPVWPSFHNVVSCVGQAGNRINSLFCGGPENPQVCIIQIFQQLQQEIRELHSNEKSHFCIPFLGIA